MNPSRAAALALGAALAGCAGVPVDELLASTAIVAELPIEGGQSVEAARFSAGRARGGPPGWGRFLAFPFARESDYGPVDRWPGVELEGRAGASAPGVYPRI